MLAMDVYEPNEKRNEEYRLKGFFPGKQLISKWR